MACGRHKFGVLGLGHQLGVHPAPDLLIAPLEDREEELLLAREVLVDRSLSDSGTLCDVGHSSRCEPLFGEHLGRRLHQNRTLTRRCG